jgi:DNA-binding CsgD family transcriptional regulator
MFAPIVFHGQDSALRLSDVLPSSSFQRSSFCQDFFKPRGVRFAIYGVIGRAANIVATVGALRDGPDFSVRERSLFDLVRVPLAGMWQQVRSNDLMRLELAACKHEQRTWGPIDMGLLTPAEEGVVRLVTSGMSNRAAAAVLNITVKGVEQHLTRVYRKFAVESRSQLILRINAVEDNSAAGNGT